MLKLENNKHNKVMSLTLIIVGNEFLLHLCIINYLDTVNKFSKKICTIYIIHYLINIIY